MNKIYFIFLFGLFLSNINQACTSFSISRDSEFLVGKSYDWHQGHGQILVNKRNMSKVALTFSPSDTPARWQSKYGSLTFNQHGQEFPLAGMNEAGLVAEILWLDESVYPKPDSRPVVNELQWIQYQLDSFATVEEVIANAESIRVANVYAKVHYFVCDKSKQCATIEYLTDEDSRGSRLVIHSQSSLLISAITNNSYEDSLDHLSLHEGFGGILPIPQGLDSLSRFVRTASLLKRLPSHEASLRDYVFDILKSVGPSERSRWHVTYSLADRNIAFRTWNRPTLKSISTNKFSYGCLTPVLALDTDQQIGGDKTAEFKAFDESNHYQLVDAGVSGMGLPESAIQAIKHYPAIATHCLE